MLRFLFSIIGASWTTAVKELIEHYAQREASYPVLKQVILESLKKIRLEKTDEHSRVSEPCCPLGRDCFRSPWRS